jgi:probable rRNA maturation factor
MVVIQNNIQDLSIDEENLRLILQNVMINLKVANSELLIRIVDKKEIQNLNKIYRNQDKPTNTLSFKAMLPNEIKESILGDVVICSEIIKQEAKLTNKSFKDHLIHIAIHGILHLLGYSHTLDKDAEQMQNMEIDILKKIQIKNPYQN